MPGQEGLWEPRRWSLPALLAEVGALAHAPFVFFSGSDRLGLGLAWGFRVGRARSSGLSFQILAPHRADSVELGLLGAGGAPSGASMRGRPPLSHTSLGVGHKSTMPHHHARLRPRCSCTWPYSQAHTTTHSLTNTARLPVTAASCRPNDHSEQLHSGAHVVTPRHTATDTRCHTQRHTQARPAFCSLGWKGTLEPIVSILLSPDRCVSLAQTGAPFNEPASIRAFNNSVASYAHTHTHRVT